MSARPTFIQSLSDRLAVAIAGGVRVRVLDDGRVIVYGRTLGPPPEKIRSIVADLAPGPGMISIRCDGRRVHVRASASAGGARLEQRLRNVLGL